MNKVLFSSISYEWATPADFFAKVDQEFHFDLDPCASPLNHKCDKYFTVKENGLLQSWSGFTVFCNPPYGRGITEKWVKKAIHEHYNGARDIVLLLPARTDTKWFHLLYGHFEIRFIKGRLQFGDVSCKNRAPFPSMLVIMRDLEK